MSGRFHRVDFRSFLSGYASAVRAIRERLPLTAEERAAGWKEDPWGSGVRWNEKTGEIDDSIFLSHPPLYKQYLQNMIDAERRAKHKEADDES